MYAKFRCMQNFKSIGHLEVLGNRIARIHCIDTYTGKATKSVLKRESEREGRREDIN